MTNKQQKPEYIRSCSEEYRVHHPYAMIVRECDGAILFINRDYVALQPTYVSVPASIVSEIASMGDTLGSQFKGFTTYWFYNDGNAPSNFIDKPEMRQYCQKMRKIAELLKGYGFNSEMYFANPVGKKNEYIHFD